MKYITPQGLKELKEKLEELKKKRQEIIKRLEEAKSLGDLSENYEYLEAKEAQSFNEGKIAELEELIKTAVVVRKSEKSKNKVSVGSIIKARNLKDGKIKEFYIVGSQESDPRNNKISHESPLGEAFLNKKLNEIVEVETPRGKMKYKIIAIQ